MVELLVFYFFGAVLVISASMVVTIRNPVFAALFLVLCFFSSAAIWLILQAEFLAIALVLVYVGAVMVLFLFVVMMLDIDFAELRAGFIKYLPVGAVVGLLLLVELVFVVGTWVTAPDLVHNAPTPPVAEVSNTKALGNVLYTQYVYLFEAAGLILLVAMIGAIVLTLHHKRDVRRQSISAQVARTPETAIEVVEVESGRGLK